jgi:hypothetical protein
MELRTEMQLSIRTRVPVIVCAAIAALTSGCALINAGSAVERITAERPFLPPLQSERNVIDLEVYFVDRVVGDPTIGDGLWRAVNQAAGPLSTHARLRNEGIQYGVAPSSAPPALQSLISRGFGTSSTKVTSVVNVPLINGSASPIHVGKLPGSCVVPSSGKKGVGAITVDQGECMFKVAAERLQEGWVKVAFLPQIHYGAERVRPTATDERWENKNSRLIETYYDQEFSLELNTGEFVVVGLSEDRPGTLGHLFFRSGDAQSRFQRVMIVRLAGMQSVKPMRSDRGTF